MLQWAKKQLLQPNAVLVSSVLELLPFEYVAPQLCIIAGEPNLNKQASNVWADSTISRTLVHAGGLARTRQQRILLCCMRGVAVQAQL